MTVCEQHHQPPTHSAKDSCSTIPTDDLGKPEQGNEVVMLKWIMLTLNIAGLKRNCLLRETTHVGHVTRDDVVRKVRVKSLLIIQPKGILC